MEKIRVLVVDDHPQMREGKVILFTNGLSLDNSNLRAFTQDLVLNRNELSADIDRLDGFLSKGVPRNNSIGSIKAFTKPGGGLK